MAQMIPNTLEDDHGSFGERKVFEALRDKLDEEFVVFHSVRWNAPNEKNTIIWGECDFTVFNFVTLGKNLIPFANLRNR